MKFLKNTATDLFARNARFINFAKGSPEFKQETEIVDKDTAKESLHKDTQERLEALKYSGNALRAANEANKAVNDKLPNFWNKLQGLKNPAPEQLRVLAAQYLVNKNLTGEAAKMYRTEMFASFQAALGSHRDNLELTDSDVSNLLLKGMAEVYTYKTQSVHSSLWSASRMMKYDANKSGVNVKDWTAGGSIMRFESKMKRSNIKATVDASGKLVIGDKAYDISGCEILTGSAMAEYSPKYLSNFLFQNLVIEGDRVMARVENGCKGNLAVFKLGTPVVSVTPSTGGGSGSEGTPGKTPRTKPETTTDTNIEVDTEKPEAYCDDFPQLGMECALCDDKFGAEQIWNGLNNDDEAARQALEQSFGQRIENIEQAREAYLKLYGRREWDKTGETIKKDGIYVVMEKYFNPAVKVPVIDMFSELFNGSSLAKRLNKAGYSGTEIEELFVKLRTAESQYKEIEGNVSAKLATNPEDKNAGATKDFLLRAGAGAVVGIAVAAALGISVASAPIALFAGVPVIKVRGKIKSFTPYPNVEQMYATLADPNVTVEDLLLFAGEGQKSTEQKTYAEIQKDALVGADVTHFLAYDALDTDIVLAAGPNPDLDEAERIGRITPAERQQYDRHQETFAGVEEKMDTMLDELAENGYYFEKGAEHEAIDSSKGGIFKLKGSDKKAFYKSFEAAKNAHLTDNKNELYTNSMDELVDRFNDVAQDELDVQWAKSEELTMTSLSEAFKYGKDFRLGTLPRKAGDPLKPRELWVKFVPDRPGQASNTSASGEWRMYIKEENLKTGVYEVSPQTMVNYRSAQGLVKKGGEKRFTIENLTTNSQGGLPYSPYIQYSRKERKIMQDKLAVFDLMVGQLSQLNETKDQMSLTVENHKRITKTAEIGNMFNVQLDSKGEVETESEHRYRIAVTSKLAKYKNAETFNKHLGQYFSPAVRQQVEAVYNKTPNALQTLIENKDFEQQMRSLTCVMKTSEAFISTTDLNECAKCAKQGMYFSGQAAGKESKYHTITVGDLFLAHTIGKGLVNKNVTKTLTEIFKYDTGGKTESGQSIIYNIEVEKEITEKVAYWQTKGWLDINARKAIIALTGGHVTNMMIDKWANQPGKTSSNTKSTRIVGNNKEN